MLRKPMSSASMQPSSPSGKPPVGNGTGNVVQIRRKSVTRKPVTDDAILAAFVERPSVVAVSRRFRVGDLYVCGVLARYLPSRRTAA